MLDQVGMLGKVREHRGHRVDGSFGQIGERALLGPCEMFIAVHLRTRWRQSQAQRDLRLRTWWTIAACWASASGQVEQRSVS